MSLFKANLKRHIRSMHTKTVTEADLILKQMQTARLQRVEAEEERFKMMLKMKREQRCKERNEEERGFKMKEQ